MEIPRIDPVGLKTTPEGFDEAPRTWPRWLRISTTVLVAVFFVVTVVTTAVSLGAYCLTTDASDTRSLPAEFVDPTSP